MGIMKRKLSVLLSPNLHTAWSFKHSFLPTKRGGKNVGFEFTYDLLRQPRQLR